MDDNGRDPGPFLPLLLSALLLAYFPADAAAQNRWRAVFVEGGLAGGPQGWSEAIGLAAELGVSHRFRAVARWSHRSRAGISLDAENPADSNVLEAGPGVTLSAGSRIVSYANLLMGVHWEKKPWSSEWKGHGSVSVSVGWDIRIFPPVTLRLAVRHQEVPGSAMPERGRSNARNTGVLAGVGISFLGGGS